MDKNTNKIINQYIRKVAENKPELLSSILFGSYAKGTEQKDSDIDIALVFDDFKDDDKFDLQTKLLVWATEFDTRIELHPILQKEFDIENPFVAEIKKTGRKLENWKKQNAN